MGMSHLLTIATGNSGKLKEIKALLKDLPFQIKTLKDFPQIGPIDETGTTFVENALIKARAVHKVAGDFVLADDSGLVCDDLAGEPGVYSARFAGPNATDEENNQELIHRLSQIHDPSRRARYVCVLALIGPDGSEKIIEETCEGMITFAPSGTGGFGYDPYFVISEKGCTMAEISMEEKNKISHRGKAMKKLLNVLKTL